MIEISLELDDNETIIITAPIDYGESGKSVAQRLAELLNENEEGNFVAIGDLVLRQGTIKRIFVKDTECKVVGIK